MAALLVTALLSVGVTAHGCKTARMLSLAGVVASLDVGHASTHVHGSDIGATAHQPADLLRQGGPCHLLMAVALLSGGHWLASVALPASWPIAAVPDFSSRSWPPPEHRPRAA